jgi:hypothetical protein
MIADQLGTIDLGAIGIKPIKMQGDLKASVRKWGTSSSDDHSAAPP